MINRPLVATSKTSLIRARRSAMVRSPLVRPDTDYLTPIMFHSIGAAGNGGSSTLAAYPATIVAGNALLLIVSSKYVAPVTPLGWTLISQSSGGVGIVGADTGTVHISVYYKIADGTETGNVTVVTTLGNSVQARIAQFNFRFPGFTWDFAGAVGADNVADGTWLGVMGTDPGVQAGDFLLACSARNTDVALTSTITDYRITAADAVISAHHPYRQPSGTVIPMIGNTSTTFGDDSAQSAQYAAVVAGKASDVMTLSSLTLALAAATGVTAIVRMRGV